MNGLQRVVLFEANRCWVLEHNILVFIIQEGSTELAAVLQEGEEGGTLKRITFF